MSPNPFFKKHPKLTLVIFNVSLLIFLLVIFEIVLRIFTPDWLQYKMNMLKSGTLKGYGTDANWKIKYKDGEFYSFVPNSTFKMYHFEYENTVHINTLGGRRTADNEIHDTGNIIPFIGDSFIMGVGVEDSETIVSFTKNKLNYNFLNLGIAGTGLHTQHKVINLRRADLGNPKTVIYGFWTGNDFDDIIQENLRDTIKKSDSSRIAENNSTASSGNGFMWKLNYLINNNKFLNKIYFLQFIKQKILNIKNKETNPSHIDPFFLIVNKQNESYINEAKKYLDKEIDSLSKEPYKSIFIIIPHKYQVYPTLRKTMTSYYNLDEKNIEPFLPNQIIKEVLDKYKIPYIDATDCLIKHKDDGVIYYTKDNHFTKLGQQIISSCISSELGNILQQSQIITTD